METTLDLPTAISLINGRYLLFSADVVSYLRREHHICGVLIGSIPHLPQQNVFLGLPLELMPEEAQLLVEKDIAFILDDARAHEEGLRDLKQKDREDYLSSLRSEGSHAAKQHAGLKEQKRNKALKRRCLTPSSDHLEEHTKGHKSTESIDPTLPQFRDSTEDSLFTSPPEPSTPISVKPLEPSTLAVTPAISTLLLPTPTLSLTNIPASYPLFAHLHNKGYFLSPGLRFGCQYLVYPGDPLRFHSHFLAVGVDWDEEIDLMDIVGGGRLGTGVKKGYLLGGKETTKQDEVRTFSIEWAGM